jgi:PE family
MSSVTAAPELISTAATDLANIGSNLSAAHMAAAAPTTGVVPAAADEVSASIAHLFSAHAQDYQALAGRAAAFHHQFMQNLAASAGSYASAEAANAAVLKPLNAVAGSVASDMQGQNEMDNFLFFLFFPIFKFFDELPQELALLIALLLLA